MWQKGFYILPRDVKKHPAIKNLDELMIYNDLVRRAAFKERTVYPGGRAVTLRRGQLALSNRKFKDDYGMADATGRRFLKRLSGAAKGGVGDALVDVAISHGISVITICKYEEMQSLATYRQRPSTDGDDATMAHSRRSGGAKRTGGKIKKQTRAREVWQFDALNVEDWRYVLGPPVSIFCRDYAENHWNVVLYGPSPWRYLNHLIPDEVYLEYGEAWGWKKREVMLP